MLVALHFLSLISISFSFKFLVYNPLFAHSHATFMGKMADTLVEAGHDVTVLLPIFDETLENKTGVTSNAKLIKVEQEPRTKKMMEHRRKGAIKAQWTMDPSPLGLWLLTSNWSYSRSYTCEALLQNQVLLEQLRSEKFDVGIAEPISLCGFGLFEHINIKSTIGTVSNAYLDIIPWYLGEPVIPSFVPSFSSNDADEMTIFGRFKNAIGSFVGSQFVEQTFAAEAVVLSNVLGKDYRTNYGDLIGNTSLMFVNSNPYLNFPFPKTQKTVEIGGISIDLENTGELGEEWNRELDERSHTVFISFGSNAFSKDMPSQWKESILKVCASLPDVTFIWKYEESTDMADHVPNLHLAPWLPQTALLADPRLSLFISHGGLSSTTEVAYLGKPAIMIPLIGDQPRNARMLERHGSALVLHKTDLDESSKLKAAIETILQNENYSEAAHRLSDLLRGQSYTAKETVVKHSEFVARFGPLRKLDPYGRHLNFFQYYLLDVVAVLLCTLVIIVTVFLLLLRLVFRKISCSKKIKQQ